MASIFNTQENKIRLSLKQVKEFLIQKLYKNKNEAEAVKLVLDKWKGDKALNIFANSLNTVEKAVFKPFLTKLKQVHEKPHTNHQTYAFDDRVELVFKTTNSGKFIFELVTLETSADFSKNELEIPYFKKSTTKVFSKKELKEFLYDFYNNHSSLNSEKWDHKTTSLRDLINDGSVEDNLESLIVKESTNFDSGEKCEVVCIPTENPEEFVYLMWNGDSHEWYEFKQVFPVPEVKIAYHSFDY